MSLPVLLQLIGSSMVMVVRATNTWRGLAILTLLLADAPAFAGFNISINIDFANTSLDSAQQAAFTGALTNAQTTWETLITGYLAPGVSPLQRLVINASSPYIDGSGAILGMAGPTDTFVADRFLYSDIGVMEFDSADVAWLIASNSLVDVILHEMAHVIGFGTTWNSTGWDTGGVQVQNVAVDGSGRYTGANALAEWRVEFAGQANAIDVPVELGGGSGTADGHWNEVDGGGGATGIVRIADGKDMLNELMTGWLNSGVNFISQTTVCSFRDIGYTTTGVCPIPGTVLLLALGIPGLLVRRRSGR